jgi:putative phosphoribosyl transferase
MSMLSEFRHHEPKQIEVEIQDPSGDLSLSGKLFLPEHLGGLVLFAHGSGSTKDSPRNQKVAKELANHRIGSLLFDLLTPAESEDRRNVFNVGMLASRLSMATGWLRLQSFYQDDPIAYYGASTGSAAALMAAARERHSIAGVVSRGGRPDLVPNAMLMKIDCPVLLLVGSLDDHVLDWNRKSATVIPHAKLKVVEGATHLFEEPGKMDQVSAEASAWFQKCFREKELEKLINLQ